MLFLYHFGRAQSGTFEHIIGIFVRFGGATAGSNGSNESNRSYRSNGATGTKAGIVWVADILSQRGVV